MASASYTPERGALVLADAFVMGDKAAAQKWSITDKTVRNYRAKLGTDNELNALYAQAKARLVADWSEDAQAFMSMSMKKLVDLVSLAENPDQIGEIAKAAQIVGELLVMREAIREPESDSESQAGQKTPRGAARPLVS